MIRPAQPHPAPGPTGSIAGRPSPSDRSSAFGRPFWLAYVSNTLVMVAIALLFRYADFVALLGGKEFHLGWIVGIGMVGSLAMRLVLGVGIDHYGPRLVWVGSIALLAVACFGHLALTSHAGPAIYLLRIAFCCAVAGVFGASMTFISSRAPAARTAELIGVLGTSGFLGMILGVQLGDLLLGTETITAGQIRHMFLAAGSVACLATIFATLAARGHGRPVRRKRPPLIEVLRRYHPGTVFFVGVVMGIALGLPGTFLRTYTDALGIRQIGLFFSTYAMTAIVVRLFTRRLPERLGTKPMILAGLAALALSQLLLLVVRVEWHLIVPGIGFGISHAVLFPSVVAAGTRRFPAEHRGLGTTLILSTWDIGQMVGAPMAGLILHFCLIAGMPAYPILFISITVLLTAVWLIYALLGQRGRSNDQDGEERSEDAAFDSQRRPHRKETGDRHPGESVEDSPATVS